MDPVVRPWARRLDRDRTDNRVRLEVMQRQSYIYLQVRMFQSLVNVDPTLWTEGEALLHEVQSLRHKWLDKKELPWQMTY